MFENFFALLGLSKSSTLGGFLGAAVSLRFIPGPWFTRLATAAAGWVCATVLAPLVLDLAQISVKPHSELGVAFLIGLFGMSIVAQIIVAIPEWVVALKEKIFGRQGA